MDQHLPGQALYEEAGRDSHGQREGQPGGLGGRREAGAEELARSAMLRAAHKLPIKTKFITRAGGN